MAFYIYSYVRHARKKVRSGLLQKQSDRQKIGFRAGVRAGGAGLGRFFQSALVAGAIASFLRRHGRDIFQVQAALCDLWRAGAGIFSAGAVGRADDRLGRPQRNKELINYYGL